MTRNIFEIPLLIRRRPEMYLTLIKWFEWNKKISSLFSFIHWYLYWVGDWTPKNRKILNIDKWHDFNMYIIINTVWYDKANEEWISAFTGLLIVCDYDEEKALDLFYQLLDQFIEQEWIKINID